MKKYLKLMRIKHYVKNGLILLPLLFSGQMFNTHLLPTVLFGIVAFSFASSAVYIINDIKDAPNDRKHPTKCERPIASNEITTKSAWILVVVLLLASSLINYFVCGGFGNWIAWGIIFLYVVLNLGYSLGLKNVPIVDISILVTGFLLRILYGAAITGIEISSWLYLTVMAMSFYLGLGKRRNELARQSDDLTRKVLQFYNNSFLDKNMYMCLALAIVFYSLWSVDPMTISRLGDGNLVWTVPMVILICMKYSLTVEGNSDGDPVEVMFADKILLGLVGTFGLLVMGIIYV